MDALKRRVCAVFRAAFAAALLALLFAAQSAPASAQQRDGISELTDKEVRVLLLQRIETDEARAAGFNPAISIFALQRTFGDVRRKLAEIAHAVPELPELLPEAWERFVDASEGSSIAWFLFGFAVSMAAGYGADRLIRLRVTPVMRGILARRPEGLATRIYVLGAALLWAVLGLAAFTIVAAVVYLTAFEEDAHHRITFFFYLTAVVIFRAALIVSQVFHAHPWPQVRITSYDNATARHFHRAVVVTVGFAVFGFFTCALMGTLGMGGPPHSLLLIIIGTVTSAGLMATTVRGRGAMARDLTEGRGLSKTAVAAMNMWPWIFAASVLLIWTTLVLTELSGDFEHVRYGGGLLTILLLYAVPSLDAALNRESVRLQDAADDAGAALMRALRMVFGFGSVILISTAWGLDPMGMTANASLGSALWQVAITAMIAYVIWQYVRLSIDRRIREEDALAKEQGLDDDAEMGGTGLSRARTLLPLMKRTSQILIGSIAGMVVLSALGVDIGPVLAGAGVIGIAIGFGSQTLVRDIVSGVFFLVDDAFRLGEYIDVGEVRGAVEKMSLRSLRLRHHLGMVHTVPFGEIKTLTNFSRDWVIMKLRFRVPFGTDTEKVRKLFKQAGQEMLADPVIGGDFIQPFKSQGVLEVDDYGMIVRGKFMAKPGKQFLIRRKAFAKVQEVFEENGIEFAQPIVKVSVGHENGGEGGEATEETRQKAAAAAASAVAQRKAQAGA
ncbi:MAG: mechanosensitive ion channel family protein [Rhodospirillales bacterium]